MQKLLDAARKGATGYSSDGRCYEYVAKWLDKAGGYGKMANSDQLPQPWAYARQFAEGMDRPGNLEKYGMQKLKLDNPYDAPPGAIIVVRAGAPGTYHPTAGDISIAGGNGKFYNDGEMGYRGRAAWPPGNNYVLGIYVPK